MLLLAGESAAIAAAPWWGVPVIAGAFALGGALVTLCFTWLRDRRTHDLRWERDLREVAARFFTLAANEVTGAAPSRAPTGEATFNDTAKGAYHELWLLAPPKVVVTASEVLHCVTRIQEMRAAGDSVAEGLKRIAVVAYRDAVVSFIKEVRLALGVKEGLDPKSAGVIL